MEHNLVIDILGWAGAVALLSAYALVSAKKMEGDSVPYQVLNLVGSGALVVNSLYYGAYPSSGVNVIWILIGFLALSRKWWGGRRPSDSSS